MDKNVPRNTLLGRASQIGPSSIHSWPDGLLNLQGPLHLCPLCQTWYKHPGNVSLTHKSGRLKSLRH